MWEYKFVCFKCDPVLNECTHVCSVCSTDACEAKYFVGKIKKDHILLILPCNSVNSRLRSTPGTTKKTHKMTNILKR